MYKAFSSVFKLKPIRRFKNWQLVFYPIPLSSRYLSARKVRSRFQTLVAQAIEKSHYRDLVKLAQDTTEVRMIMRDNISVCLPLGVTGYRDVARISNMRKK